MAAERKHPGIRRLPGRRADQQLRRRAIPGVIPTHLPLIHVTHVGSAREIIASRKLEVRPCPVFKRGLLYFFVLRPAYKLRDGDEKSHQINRFPFVFVLDPRAIEAPFHAYPFDTGGATVGAFDEQADPHVILDDYELEPSFEGAAGHIAWAFGSLAAYFEGDIRGDILDDVPVYETVTRSFVDIAKLGRTGSNQPDRRASAVEIASSQDIALKGNILVAIIPKQYLEDSGTKNIEFMEALKRENIDWRTYDWQPNKTPNELQHEIANITRSFLVERNIMS